MAVDGSNCPEDSNSTDCLLRSLMRLLNEQKKAEDNETNWDPITFFFTLPVGILATIFAITTVFQGILVAGKGRRKTNKRAIGKWHQATEWHWNWQDMSFESRAWVPILREDTWNMQPDFIKDYADKEETPQRPSHLTWLTTATMRIGRHLGKALKRCLSWLPHSWVQKLPTWKQWVNNSQSRYQTDPAASWVRFFERIGLEYFDDPKYRDHLQPVTADYLPDDLIAAPAYGQVGAIIAAAAATGAHIKMTDSNSLYPVIFGRQFQFDFRQHPTLGIIDAYSQYVTQGGNDNKALTEQKDGLRKIKSGVSPPLGKLSLAMKNCRGEIGLEEGIMLSSTKMPRPSLNLYKETHRFQLIKRLGDLKRNDNDTSSSHDGPDDVDAYCPIIIFFLAATPTYTPSLFPASILESKLPLTPVGLNGKYWSALCLEAFDNLTHSEWPIGHGQPQWPGFNDLWKDIMPLKMDDFDDKEDYSDYISLQLGYMMREMDRKRASHSDLRHQTQRRKIDAMTEPSETSKKQEGEVEGESSVKKAMEDTFPTKAKERKPSMKAIQGDDRVLHVCIIFLRSPPAFLKWFATSSASNQEEIRHRTHRQLVKVQGWLEKKGREYVNSRLLLLSKTTVILLKAHKAAVGDHASDHSRAPDPSSQLEVGSRLSTDETFLGSYHSSALHSLRTLLKSFGLDKPISDDMRKIRDFTEENDMFGRQGIDMMLEHWKSIGQVRDKVEKNRSDLLKYFSGNELSSRDCYANVYCLLERLAIVVAHNSSLEDSDTEWERLKELDSTHNDTDDIIIYRYLMLAILYRTALDSGKMLHSGVWDQVVPII